MKCPRCGAEMSGGICNNCGFPTNRVQRATSFVRDNSNCFIYIFTHIDRYKNGKGEQKDLRRLARHRFRCNNFKTEFAF